MRLKRCRSLLLVWTVSLFGTLPVQAQNVVTNGDFETGDLTGWIVTTDPANPDGPAVGIENEPQNTHSGVGAVTFFNSDYMDQLSQTVSTTAGQAYQLTFFLAANPGYPGTPVGIQQFDVSWNGTSILTSADPRFTPSFDYQQFTVTGLTADDILSTLSFSGRNEPGAFYLDDISLVAVPEASTWAISAIVAAWLARSYFVSRQRLSPLAGLTARGSV